MYADFFNARSPKLCNEDTFGNSNEVSCPGSYGYSMVPLFETKTVQVELPISTDCRGLILPIYLEVKCPSCENQQRLTMMNERLEGSAVNESQDIQSICLSCAQEYVIRAKMKVEIIYQTEGISSK